MKKFFEEFRKFISKGNVMDMAVGIIVGGAFAAIITALVNNILTPLINWIPGADNTGALQVVLRDAITDDAGNVITEALIIDFGAVISAIISFLVTAFVLFLIIKTVNHVREKSEKLVEEYKKKQKEENGETEQAAEETVEQPSVPETPVIAAPTSEQLLAEIRDLLKAQNTNIEKD